MRKVIDLQMKFGETPIDQIKFDLKARDEIPKLLIGLQYLYCTPEIRNKVFDILKRLIPDGRILKTEDLEWICGKSLSSALSV